MSALGPLDTEPTPGTCFTPEQREAALTTALRGVKLGDFDRQVFTWAVLIPDGPIVFTLATWLERVRAAGPAAVDATATRQVQSPGNSGPGF